MGIGGDVRLVPIKVLTSHVSQTPPYILTPILLAYQAMDSILCDTPDTLLYTFH